MGGWQRTPVGVWIGAALGTGSARAVSLRATFDPSSDPSVDSYLAFDCQGDATICTQDSFVSGSEVWTQVDNQPASVVCAATPCAETFTVGDPAPGQTETLTVAMVARDPAGPSLSGPSNVISVTLVGSSSTSTTQPPTTTTVPPSTTTTPVTTSTTTTTPPAFVQVAAATPQTNQTSVPVTFAGAQTAGNVNLVAIGWNSSSGSVSSVVDSAGNVYQPAAPVQYGSGVSQ